MKRLRSVFQLAFLGLALGVGLTAALGESQASVEGFCPMGGLAVLPALLSEQRFSCSTGESNLAALLALVGLALVARKSFCAWLCPVGTLLEWLGRLGARLRGQSVQGASGLGLVRAGRGPDRLARWLRLGVLGAVVVATYHYAELVFRPFCPYYALASLHGHDVEAWSYGLLALVLGSALVLSMAWCRYLCPLGGALWPFSRAARLRVARDARACTECGRCDRACPHDLRPSQAAEVRSGECTLCLECRAACPARGALQLQARAGGLRARAPAALVPGLVLGLAGLAWLGSGWFALPSYAWEPARAAALATPLEARFTVDGVRCVDTARRAVAQLEALPGVARVTAYASRHTLEVVYDGARADAERIRRALEAPLVDAESGQIRFHVYKVREIDGRAVGD